MMKYFVTLASVVAIAQALHYGDGIDVKINVEKNSNSYLSGQLPRGSFEYGLNVDKQKDNHFQHKVKGPDDVTYGCYGFVDPDGKPHLVHYVSDLKGYRIVTPDYPTKVYVSPPESGTNNVYQPPQEKTVEWKDLFFPPACKESLNDLDITPEPATTPSTTPYREPTTPSTTRRPFVPSTPRPTPPPRRELEPTTRRPYVPVTPKPSPPLPPPNAIDPEPKPSDMCPSVVQAPPDNAAPQPVCSELCDELKGELEDIKTKLQTLLDTLAEKQQGGAGGDGTKFAYFPVMLSDGLPDGVDPSSSKFAFPSFPQQCGSK